MNRIKVELDEQELRRLSGVLEAIANRSDLSPDEVAALETAMIALMAVNLTRWTQAAYRKLASAHNGILSDEMKADLREHGFDVDELEKLDGD